MRTVDPYPKISPSTLKMMAPRSKCQPRSATNTRLAECGSRQAIQAGPDHSNSMVFQFICIRWHQPHTDLFATRFNKLPQFRSPASDSLARAVDALILPWEDLDPYAFPPVAMQENHSDCSGVAQHDQILESGSHVKPDPPVPAQPAKSDIQ